MERLDHEHLRQLKQCVHPVRQKFYNRKLSKSYEEAQQLLREIQENNRTCGNESFCFQGPRGTTK